jgi:hypothetical protein
MARHKTTTKGFRIDGPAKQATTLVFEVNADVHSLRALCGELYQVLGTVGAPVSVLDKVSAAAAGKPIPDIDLLPIDELAFDEVRERQETIDEMASLLAKHLAARGGRASSDAKRRAARENGRMGGRPRKTIRA